MLGTSILLDREFPEKSCRLLEETCFLFLLSILALSQLLVPATAFAATATKQTAVKESKKTENKIIAQTYLGPKESSATYAELIRVQLSIKDSPDPSGLQIQNVTFNGQNVPLKPRDVFSKRGEASFQLPPGKYILRWTANRNSYVWPRVLRFEEEVDLDPRDLWVQIMIEGDKASIR